MTELEKLLRFHILDSRNSGEEAIVKLRLAAADRIAELEGALRSIKTTLIKVNEGIEMGGIDSELLSMAVCALRETD